MILDVHPRVEGGSAMGTLRAHLETSAESLTIAQNFALVRVSDLV